MTEEATSSGSATLDSPAKHRRRQSHHLCRYRLDVGESLPSNETSMLGEPVFPTNHGTSANPNAPYMRASTMARREHNATTIDTRPFKSETQHRKCCACPCDFDRKGCRLREGDAYSRCVHWFWQVHAQPHLWTPEIYESVRFLITITRIIKPKEFGSQPKKHSGTVISILF